MKLIALTIAILMSTVPLVLHAEAMGTQCKDLFIKDYKTKTFVISIEGKSQSQQFLAKAHDNLIKAGGPLQLIELLQSIVDEGVENLTDSQRAFILDFRQSSSLLRSIFQTSDKDHASPNKFAGFVKDFGTLKDLLAIDDNANAQILAAKILKKYSNLDFKLLIKKADPASKKSVAKYFNAILADAKAIMQKQIMTIDEMHDVRKHLRDVLRYLQIEKELVEENGQSNSKEKDKAIDFLKKINTRLGYVCDQYAGRILQDQNIQGPNRTTKRTLIEFPWDLRPRVEHFLSYYTIVIVSSHGDTTETP